MKVIVSQTKAEMGNEFDILYDDVLTYRAKLPFLTINEPFNFEKLRAIKIFDLNDNEVCRTDYNYLKNLVEELIPFKYLFNKSQKFYQIIFSMNNQTVNIYHEATHLLKSQYIWDLNDKKYICYSIGRGGIRHFPIYDGEVQVGEILKSNIIKDGKDEYWGYLKEEYSFLKDIVAFFMLYIDRTEYSTAYLLNRSYSISYKYTYNKNNKYLDENWVKNNFDDSFFKKWEEDRNTVKNASKNIPATVKAQINSMTKKQKVILITVLATILFIGFSFDMFFLIMTFFIPWS